MSSSDGSTKRNSVIQGVQNRNNIADLYLRRQMDHFKRHLALRILTIEMEKLEWHTFLKDLKKCNSDDLSEFVPFLIEEMGQCEYTNRVKKLKTRFRDIFQAFELGMTEKMQIDYVRVREEGEKAQKDHRIVKSEMRKMRTPPDAELTRPRINMNNISNNDKVTGFITNIATTPGTEQATNTSKVMEGKTSARKVHCFGAPPTNVRVFPLLPPPPPPKPESEAVLKKIEPKVEEEEKHDGDVESVNLGSDSDDGNEKRKKKDMMRKMLDKNAKSIRRRRRMQMQMKPLESRIEEFFSKIESLRCPPRNHSNTLQFPPIGVMAHN